MKPVLDNLMKNAQKVQENVEKAQAELKNTQVTGSAGAGMVNVIMTGRHEVVRVEIDLAVYKEEKAILEDLLVAAMNDAIRKIEKTTQEKMSHLMSGMGLSSALNPFFKF